jgi:ParB family chromosome partitioning protein
MNARLAKDSIMADAHRGLGRGLSALLGEDPAPSKTQESSRSPRTLPVAFLKPNRFQPRRNFNEADLNDLTNSVKEKGVLQPILVRPSGNNTYEIVAGERRWRAAQKAQLHEVPVTIKELSDAESLEIAIIENVQRADLNAIEEAAAYQELLSRFQYTQEKLGEVMGKSRSHIANTLRLLKLPESVKALVAEGALSAGHARTLIGDANAENRAKEIVAGALNVRQAEIKARVLPGKAAKAKSPKAQKDADTKALEQSVTSALGLKVEIAHEGEKGGTVRILYKNLDQLDDICRRLSTYGEID